VFAKLGTMMCRHRWAVAGAWLAVLVAGLVFGGGLFDRLGNPENLRPDAESVLAQHRIDQLAPEGPLVIAVVEGRDVYDPGLVSNVTDVVKQVKAIPGVKDVDDLYTSPGGQIGADNFSTTVVVELAPNLPEERRQQVEDQVSAHLKTIQAPSVLVGGTKLAERAFADQAVSDLAVGESVAFVLLIVALVVVFGGVVAGGLPLAVAITAVAGTLLGLLALSTVTTISQYAVNVVTLLGIGLAVDYSLLIVARYREELARASGLAGAGGPAGAGVPAGAGEPAEAIPRATATAGRAVLISGLAVAAAFGGLALFAEPLLAAMALGGAVVAVLATAAALTLVPALLAIAGSRVPPAGAETWVTRLLARLWRVARLPRRPAGPGLLARLAAFAQRRPGPVALGVTLGMLVLAAPFAVANLQNSDARALPRDNEVRRAYDVLQAKFNNQQAAKVNVVAEIDAGSPELRRFLNELNRQPQVLRLELRRDVAPGATVVDLTPKGPTAGPQSRELVRSIRSLRTPFPKQVTGEAAKVVDYQESLRQRLPVAALVLLVAMVVLLFALTGSVVIPVKALLMNLLTLFATLGVLVALFQWGWGSLPLRFDSWGGLDLTTPILLFVFVFGLSMDYEVFLLSRIKEEYDRRVARGRAGRSGQADNDRAVLAGITRSGPVVTAAAVCLGIVFLGFAVGGLVAVKEVGVGMAVAILLDVTAVRGLLLPALMTMLGEWNWWAPRRLRRWRSRSAETLRPEPAQAPEPVG
jgi:putative drug exporter of the RND superfamily